MSGVVRASLFLSIALLLGRLSGFVREVILASALGVSAAGDAAVLVLTLPDFMVGVLLTGGFNAALVPALRQLDPRERRRLYLDVSFYIGTVFALLALAVFLYPMGVATVFAPGLAAATVAPYLDAFSLMALSLPVVALTGVSAAFLNANENFFVVGLGTLVFNLVLIAALLTVFDAATGFWTLGAAVVVAALLRWGMQLASVRERVQATVYRPKRYGRGLAAQFVAGVAAMGVFVLAPVVFRTLLSSEGSGLLAAFTFAQKLYELPVVLVLTPLVTVLLPRFTDIYAENGRDHRLFSAAAVALLVLAVATLFVGRLYGGAIAALIYQRGALDQAALATVVAIAETLFLALPFAALQLLSAAALNAQKRTGLVLRNALGALALGVAVALLVPGVVVGGYVVFAAVAAAANIAALRVPLGPIWAELLGVRGMATASLMILVLMGKVFVTVALAAPLQALLALAVWGTIVAIWVPRIRPLIARAEGRRAVTG